MMLDPGLIGGIAGLVIGVVDYFVIGAVMERMAKDNPSERPRASIALNVARISQLILFPVMGWFVGQTIAS